MAACKALSMGPFQGGGAHYFSRGGQLSAVDAHECALEAGHDGPHAKRTLMPLSPEVGMQTTYLWNDEHTLRAEVEIVPITTMVTYAEMATHANRAGTR